MIEVSLSWKYVTVCLHVNVELLVTLDPTFKVFLQSQYLRYVYRQTNMHCTRLGIESDIHKCQQRN